MTRAYLALPFALALAAAALHGCSSSSPGSSADAGADATSDHEALRDQSSDQGDAMGEEDDAGDGNVPGEINVDCKDSLDAGCVSLSSEEGVACSSLPKDPKDPAQWCAISGVTSVGFPQTGCSEYTPVAVLTATSGFVLLYTNTPADTLASVQGPDGGCLGGTASRLSYVPCDIGPCQWDCCDGGVCPSTVCPFDAGPDAP